MVEAMDRVSYFRSLSCFHTMVKFMVTPIRITPRGSLLEQQCPGLSGKNGCKNNKCSSAVMALSE